jgi:hypothetical protein
MLHLPRDIRLTRTTVQGQQHLTVPCHRSLRIGTLVGIGTLNGILDAVAEHLGKHKDEVMAELFG